MFMYSDMSCISHLLCFIIFFNDTATTEIYTLSLHDALPISDRWRRFDFRRNAAVDSGPWDIAFRRFHVITARGGGIVDLGPVPFDSVRQLPAARDLSNTEATDTTNPGVGKWYAHRMLSHLLTSKHPVYGVRTAAGGYAKLELLAYYCRDVGTACLTFRYAYQGNGTRGVVPFARHRRAPGLARPGAPV